MAAKKLSPQQQRDRRAKIMLVVLGVVLLAIVGIQLPKLLKGSGSGSNNTAANTTPPVAAVTPAASPTLASASAPTQLQRFTQFTAKDPFKPGVSSTTAAPPSSTTPTSTTPKQPKAPPLTINVTQNPALTAATVPAALLMVNGKKRVVALGATFPTKGPMFRIVALSQKAIWIELVSGSLPNGKQTLKIDRGRNVTLANVTAGLRFVLSLVKPTTAPAPATTPKPAG